MNCLIVLCLCLCAIIGSALAQRTSDLSIGYPRPRCGPVCLIYCEHGNVLDHRGCPTCRCKPDPGPGPGPTPRCSSGRPVYVNGRIVRCSPFYPNTRCGPNTFCQSSPVDGPGICCRRSGGGQCPVQSRRACTRRGRRSRPCKYDWQCRWGQKCCRGPCGRVCTYVNTGYGR